MSSTIKIKRSNVSGNDPAVSDIVEGELALNTADGKLFSRGGNNIFEVGGNLSRLDTEVLNAERVQVRLRTTNSDNNISTSDIENFGKLIKVADINLTQQGDYYRTIFDMFDTTNPELKNPPRVYFSAYQDDAFGNDPDLKLWTSYDDDEQVGLHPVHHPSARVKIVTNDNAGGGAGPTKIELWVKIHRPGAGAEICVIDEVGSSFSTGRVDVDWKKSYQASDVLLNVSGISYGSTAYNYSTESKNWQQLFSSNAGLIKTTGGGSKSDITSIPQTDGYLNYDSDAGTFSHVGLGNTLKKLTTDPGDNGLTPSTDGKHTKVATISLNDFANAHYKTVFRSKPIRSAYGKTVETHFSVSTGTLNTSFNFSPPIALQNYANDGVNTQQTDYSTCFLRLNNDVSGTGAGPMVYELWLTSSLSNSEIELHLLEESISGDVDVEWVSSFDSSDNIGTSALASIGDGKTVVSNETVLNHNTYSSAWDTLFGTDAGVVVTNGGGEKTDITVAPLSTGFLHYDSDAATYEHRDINVDAIIPDNDYTQIYIGDSGHTGTIFLGRGRSSNRIQIGGETFMLNQQRIDIGGLSGAQSSELINIGGNTTAQQQTLINIGQSTYNTAATSLTQFYGDTQFNDGVNFKGHETLSGNVTGANFKKMSGKRIIHTASVAYTLDEFTPVAADVGKHWIIINASNGYEVKLDFQNQYMRFLEGGSIGAKNWIWSIAPGGIAEVVCVNTGTSSSTQPNFVIYGSGVGQD